MTASQETYLILTGKGADSPGILDSITQLCNQCNCNILESRVTTLGSDFVLHMLLGGGWSAIAKFESRLDKLATKLNAQLQCHRTELPAKLNPNLVYTIHLVASDRQGIVRDVCRFLKKFAINIVDCVTETYVPPYSQSQVFSLIMKIQIPSSVNIPHLREQFTLYCEEKNLDAVMEPYKIS